VQSSQVEEGQRCSFSYINIIAPNKRAVMVSKGIIYCYHCICTGKKYIGQTAQEEIRKQRHFIDSKRMYCKFYNAVRKHGWENFIYGIIDEYDVQYLDEREIYFINFYDTYKSGYNMTLGGQGRKKYDLMFETYSEYYKFYRENNIEKIKEKSKKYYQNNKNKKKEYYENNRENKLKYLAEWREKNKDKIKEYTEENKERLKEYNKLYYEKNKQKLNERHKCDHQKRKQKTLDKLSQQVTNPDTPAV
jgi:group I intron endonuclease